MLEPQTLKGQPTRTSNSLDTEAKRLLDFKKQHIKKGDQTPCPQCATLVNINAKKCPHCTSDISSHTRKVREELKKLNQITSQLSELHKQEMELYQQESESKPIWKRIRAFFSEPQVLQDLKIVLPTLISFFVLILFLRTKASGLVFLLISLAGGFLIYFLFKQWNVRKYITVDLYRTVLVFGLITVLSSALFGSARFWPEIFFSRGTLEVQVSAGMVREAPRTDADVVTSVSRGDDLKVLDKEGPWYKVETESGKTGWIHSTLVK